MYAKQLIGVVSLAAAFFSVTAGAQSTEYWDMPTAFPATSGGPTNQFRSAPSVFESSLLNLRETHGVGLPYIRTSAATRTVGRSCDLHSVAAFENSLLHLRETHGVGAGPSSVMVTGRNAGARC